MRYIVPLALILLLAVAVACGIPTAAPTLTLYPTIAVPTLSPTNPSAPSTPTPVVVGSNLEAVEYVLDHFWVIPTHEMLVDACIQEEIMGWPKGPDESKEASKDLRLVAAVGRVMKGKSNRYIMDVGYTSGALMVMDVPTRKQFCRAYR